MGSRAAVRILHSLKIERSCLLRLISQQRGARYSEDVRLSAENPREEIRSPKVDLSLPVLRGDGGRYTAQHPWLCSASSRPVEPRALELRKDIKHCLPRAWPSHLGARPAPPGEGAAGVAAAALAAGGRWGAARALAAALLIDGLRAQ